MKSIKRCLFSCSTMFEVMLCENTETLCKVFNLTKCKRTTNPKDSLFLRIMCRRYESLSSYVKERMDHYHKGSSPCTKNPSLFWDICDKCSLGGSENALSQTHLAVDELKATMVNPSLCIVTRDNTAFSNREITLTRCLSNVSPT